MKNAIFIDTGAFIALADRNDQHHATAKALSQKIEKLGSRFTSSLVLLETAIYLQRRISLDSSQRFWRSITSGQAQVDLVPIEFTDLERAQEISEQYADQDFSWVDCTSFGLVERLKVRTVFAFDQDFLIFQPTHGRLRRYPEN